MDRKRNRRIRLLIAAGLIVLLCCAAAAAGADVTVRFDLQGGSAAVSTLKLKPDEGGVVHFSLPAETPTRAGYRFIGWYCKGLEMEYGLDEAGKSIAFQISKGTLTYVAQWENNNHQTSCPYLMAWAGDYPQQADILQVDFKCIQDAPTTYYAVHSWTDGKPGSGYAGFQTVGEGEHVVILSIWDNGALKPSVEYAPYIRGSEDFGGEGTGKHVISNYDWQSQRWYTMRIQAVTKGSKTVYEQWIRPENGAWEKISAISFPKAGCGFGCECAFLEDFAPFDNLRRSMQLRNASARMAATGKWKTNRRYSISNYEDNNQLKYNVNYNCKAEAANQSALYMQIGGSGYEKCIRVPKDVHLKKSEVIDPYLLQ